MILFNVEDCEELSINDEKVYIYKNFYKNPGHILEYILNINPELHKGNERGTRNGEMFVDLRHRAHTDELRSVIEHFEKFTGQTCIHKNGESITTNFTKWRDDPFNNFRDNYWWPHYDGGWTLLIYLNNGNEENGLNLYQDTDYFEEQIKNFEHEKPWHSKKHYKILKQIRTPFNTAVLFNAEKLLHSCAVNNKENFHRFRLNQALFFENVE